MKIGSLVELVDDNWNKNGLNRLVTFPVKNKPYVIREVVKIGSGYGLLLEEIDNSGLNMFTEGGAETTFDITRFRELLPPISNIEETINLNLKEYENL